MKFPPLYLGFVMLAVTACKQNREIKVYRLARETDSSASSSPSNGSPSQGTPAMPGGVIPPGSAEDPHAGLSADQLSAMPPTAGPQISDEAPPHWKKLPPTSMRQASYLIEGEGGASVDVSLVILRGAAGGALGNVNRWRGQLGQPEIDEATLDNTAKKMTTPVGEAVMVEIEGLAAGADALKDGRMFGVIASNNGDGWFYKMRGNAALTAAAKDDFMRWVLSVKPATAAPSPIVKDAPVGDGKLAWQVPAGWTQSPAAASSMRYAAFTITSEDGGKGELAVSHFPGDVGGDLANVNRWRQQVNLPPVEQAALSGLVTTVSASSKTMSLVNFKGAQTSLLAAWTRHGADTWFFKLTGPDSLVAAEKTRFTAFLQSVRFTSPE